MKPPLSILALSAAWLTPALAHAQPFAQPPDGSVVVQTDASRGHRDDFDQPFGPEFGRSTLRLRTGPLLRVSNEAADGGLFAALDIGRSAAGLRLAGSWVRAGASRGASQYQAELWIDFGQGERLHPVLAAGAGVARLGHMDSTTGAVITSTAGVGTLRGSLEYVLPVRGTDARAGLDLIGNVPAIRRGDTPSSPWLLIAATVGVGF